MRQHSRATAEVDQTQPPRVRRWDLEAGQARQHRAILWVLAISFVAGLVCLVDGLPTKDLAIVLAKRIPAIDKLLSLAGNDNRALAAQVAALNLALLPLYVALLAYRQNFSVRFKEGLRRTGWKPLKATLIAYLVLAPFFLLLLLIVLVAPFPAPEDPRLWGQRFLALMLGSPVGLVALMPIFATGLSLVAYALFFLFGLPFSVVSKKLRGGPE